MNITTTITDYLGLYNGHYNNSGRSFIVKSQSGYYFPCRYAFYEYQNEPSFEYYLSFVKGISYDETGCVGCTKVNIVTEEPNFDFSLLNDYDYPTEPFYN